MSSSKPPTGSITPKWTPVNAASIGEVSFATVLGGCSGFAMKKVAKTAGLAIGVGFIGLQTLAHFDVIKINWPKIEGNFIGSVDQDGDGKLDGKDIQIMSTRLLHNLTTDVPSSGGFAVAFLAGFRYG